MRVEGSPHLKRDPHTKAIINTDDIAYKQYIAQREANDKKRLEQQEIRDEIDSIRNDVNDIKNMLFKLLEKN